MGKKPILVKEEFELDEPHCHPCITVQMFNKSIEQTEDDGTSEHAEIPDWLIKLVHGDECDAKLLDFVTKLAFYFAATDKMSPEEVVRLMSPITDEEVARLAARIKIPEYFKELFRSQYGGDPSPEDEEENRPIFARLQLEEERGMLADLPEETLREIRDKRMDVFKIQRNAKRGIRRYLRWDVDVSHLLELDGEHTRWDIWTGKSSGRFLQLTGENENGTYRWIAIVNMPTKKGDEEDEEGMRKGLVILLPFKMMATILATKHNRIVEYFPTFLKKHPLVSPRPRSRGRRRYYDDGPGEDDED
jgi:hypothetical protein